MCLAFSTMLVFFFMSLSTVSYEFVKENRSMGLSQPGRCLISYSYNIRDVPLIISYNSTLPHTNGIITNPIIYQENGYSCIDEDHIDSCRALRNTTMFQLPSELFTRHFKEVDSYMFSSDIFIALFSIFFLSGISPALQADPTVAHTLKIYCITYVIQIVAVLLSITMIYSSTHPEGIQTEVCDTSTIKAEDAATFCHTLSACGLTLSSVYRSTLPPYYEWLFMSIYSWVTFTLGVFMLGTGVSHIVLLILYGIYTICRIVYERRYDALRLDILSKQGEELTLALEAASRSFIDYYISNWTRVHATPSLQASTTGTISAPATYSPLAMVDTESGPDAALATPPPPQVTDIEYNANVCSICQNAIFTDNTSNNNSSNGADSGDSGDRRVIQLQCSHSFHQVCILQWIISADSTHTACPICRQKLK